MKTTEALKIAWMLLWRIAFFNIYLFFSLKMIIFVLIIGFVTVFGFNKTVRTWPLFNLVFKQKSPFKTVGSADKPRNPFDRPQGYKTSYGPPAVATPPGPKLTKATNPGRKTGFEPYALKNMKIQKSPWIIGDPGFGLDSSGFDETSVRLGKQGETNFAKALQKTGLIDKFQSFWSVGMVDKISFTRDPNFSSDIDCILFNGTTVYLVDLKNYKGGALTYTTNRSGSLECRDDATGQAVEVSSKMSQNMSMAQERMVNHLRPLGYNVETRVVFMPTDSGEATLKNVSWPGGIRAVNLSSFISELTNAPHFNTNRDHSHVSTRLKWLVKA